MSDVTCEELSQKLYTISGWGKHFKGELQPYWQVCDFQYVQDGGDVSIGYKYQLDDLVVLYPAYTFGFLRRKLPRQVGSRYLTLEVCDHNQQLEWTANYYSLKDNFLFEGDTTHGDTPENATAKLCIELLKRGVI